jgi:hypothetical protein
MPIDPLTALAMIESALRVGMEGYQMAKRLTAEGYTVPSLEEFERQTMAIRNLPDLTPITHTTAQDGEECPSA